MNRAVFVFTLALVLHLSSAFVVTPTRSAPLRVFGQPELEPEPEGGEEIVAISTMEDTRMKNMGEVEGATSEDGIVCSFWLSSTVNGELIRELKTTVLKDAKKKANFPGFRKGQIPPYAMPQIVGFAVQEGLIKTVENAVAAFGLKSLPGAEGEVNILEDVKEMTKGYKDGESLKFTATLKCAMEPKEEPVAEAAGKDVVDAEIVIEEDGE